MKRISLIIIVFLLTISCSQKPEFVRVDNVVVSGLKDSLILVKMDYVVYNPNDVKSKLKQSGMEIFYKDSLVGRGFLDKEISLKPNETISVPVRCEIILEKLHHYYAELLLSESTAFTVKGNSKVSFMLNSFTIDMDDEIQLNTKQIIHQEIRKNLAQSNNFKVHSIKANKLPSLNSTELNLQVISKNNLPLDYTIENMELNFFMKNDENAIAKWTLGEPISQIAFETTNIPVEVSLDNLSFLKNVNLSWLTDKNIKFNILGSVNVKINGYEFEVPIEDTLKMGI